MSHDLISGPGGVDVEKVAEILARKAEEVLARETALEEREEKVERREREVDAKMAAVFGACEEMSGKIMALLRGDKTHGDEWKEMFGEDGLGGTDGTGGMEETIKDKGKGKEKEEPRTEEKIVELNALQMEAIGIARHGGKRDWPMYYKGEEYKGPVIRERDLGMRGRRGREAKERVDAKKAWNDFGLTEEE